MLENKLFEALLDVVPFGAYAVDIETYEIVYANKLIRENIYAAQEKHCWQQLFAQEEICNWCSIEKLKEIRAKRIKNEKYICEFFDEANDKWIKSYDEIINWPDGREVKYSILVDISDQKEMLGSIMKAHASLAMKNKQVLITNKNLQITKLKLQKSFNELEIEKHKADESTKSKSNFLANMSHEIRTPMNGIIGMTYLVKQTSLDKQQLNYINKIESASNNLLNIINDILDFSKIEAGKLEIDTVDFDMNEVVLNVVDLVGQKAKEKYVNFNIIYGLKDSILYGDPLRIGQILINLLNNAIKFTFDGEVRLTVENMPENIVRFCVKDTGIGIKKQHQDGLFEAFSQAEGSITRNYGGSGLGLTISKQLVELMGGKIWVESEIGVGSEFIFELQLKRGDKSKINTVSIATKLHKEIQKLQSCKILLAEDNELNQEIIQDLLEESSIIVEIANNGQEAVEKFKKNSYELIIMDIQMPIMDGFEATQLIRVIDKDIPIIAFSANAMKKDLLLSEKAGMNEHLNKPVDVEKLYATLLKYLGTVESNKEHLEIQEQKRELPHVEINELFNSLLKAVHTNRPKECEPLIKEIKTCKLSSEYENMFSKSTNLLKHYKFKEAAKVLETGLQR